MKIIRSKQTLRTVPCVVTVGAFDGLHRGHQFVIKRARQEAHKRGLPLLLITFSSPPSLLTKKSFLGCILSASQKRAILKDLGVDYLWVIPLTAKFLRLPGNVFIEMLRAKIAIGVLVVGEDFRFGHRSRWGLADLKRIAREDRFRLLALKKKKIGGRIVSSSMIRTLIAQGHFQKLPGYLGREYVLEAPVVRGRGIGTRIGFPTANLDVGTKVIPAPGIYSARVFSRNCWRLALCYVGRKPTVQRAKGEGLSVEVHVINAHLRLARVRLKFIEKVRNDKRFSSLTALQRAIQNDITATIARYGIG